jgi:anti-anti-sigma regulatory factor
MNDPRHFDASRSVGELLDQGTLGFVLEMSGVRETGPTLLGLLTTLTRMIRNEGGEAVLANISPQVETFLDEMRMDAYWDVFDDAETAVTFLDR